MAQIQVIPKIMDRVVERTIFQTMQQGLSSALQFHRATRPPRLKISASYANERSSVISVSFDEDKRTPKAVITIVIIFLLFTAIPVSLMACKTPRYTAEIPRSVEGSTSTSNLHSWSTEQVNSEKGAFNPRRNVESVQSEDESRQGDKSTQNLYWVKPQPVEHCVGFGMREYTARLWNLPLFADWTEVCNNTKAKIHGVSLKPSYCENKWPFGGVVGHWVVDFNEEDCTPHWGKFVDKGCLLKGSKTRVGAKRPRGRTSSTNVYFQRFQSRLWKIKHRQDWRIMCENAPANHQSLKNATPKLCDDHGIWGIYGTWEVNDPNC
ncbi:hypothetical protein BYT27DRAFT_7335593 [Phlegmacium glaucopus]|nr:hypothetical protein BYT27DRAFT_7335593 [Phlegmacium glaucopus]